MYIYGTHRGQRVKGLNCTVAVFGYRKLTRIDATISAFESYVPLAHKIKLAGVPARELKRDKLQPSAAGWCLNTPPTHLWLRLLSCTVV